MSGIDLKTLHPEATFLRILSVKYVHLTTLDGGDLYVTESGLPFIEQLQPENWYEPKWFKSMRTRLEGSGTVYRLPTRPVDGLSLDLVVKWSRVGQDVPLNTFALERNLDAEFNSPFEEFALLEELRRGEHGPPDVRILTQKPLAIYVPPEELQLWQTGRSRQRILARAARHPGIEIDVLRSYVMIYGWIDGLDAVEVYRRMPVTTEQRNRELRDLTATVEQHLAAKGFMVADNKPAHIILRMDGAGVRRRRDGRVPYALIDYELLSRTAEYEQTVRAAKRGDFATRLHERFLPRDARVYTGEAVPWNVMGVDYVVAHSESTGGTIWVVGNDPELVPYLLPERWRSKQVRLSTASEVYYTETKDRIEVVWRVSRVGELPPGSLKDPNYRQVLLQGYNSPFEEVSLALDLARSGVCAAVPLAVYVTPTLSGVGGVILDERRFERMSRTLGPNDQPVLPVDHDFITVWAYWRGVEDSQRVWTPINAVDARTKGLIDGATYAQLLPRHAARLAAAGMTAVQLRPDHVLLSYIPEGPVQLDGDGFPVLCQCNFELMQAAGG